MTLRLTPKIVASLSLLILGACGSADDPAATDGSSVGANAAGRAGGSGGPTAGRAGAPIAGAAGKTSAGSSGAPTAGAAGSGGSAGSAGANAGNAGNVASAGGSSAGMAGTAGKASGGAGAAGTAGKASGGAGAAGTAGKASGGAGTAGASGAGGGSGATGGSAGSGAAGGPSAGGFGELVSASLYEQMFPNHDPLFSYDGLVAAGKTFPAFASEGSLDDRKREIAALLANIGHETTGGWPTAPGGAQAWGLYFKQEVGCEGGACTGYCEPSNAQYPCAPGKTYHGRGPIQLSYNYNYGACGDALGVNLLADPDLVTSNPTVTFRTALWFWMTPQAPKPSAHAVMTGQFTPSAQDTSAGRVGGFGLTIDIINGGVECGFASPPQVLDRVAFYEKFCGMLGVDPGPNLTCASMKPF